MNRYFITSTNTGAGKTFICEKILNDAIEQGISVKVLKPIESGFDGSKDCDSMRLSAITGQTIADTIIYQFKPAIAPHLAAQQQGIQIDIQHIQQRIMQASHHQLMLIEGAGGWMVPLGNGKLWQDVIKPLNIPLIVVVNIELGCINHALLTFQAIKAQNIEIKGWIANIIKPDDTTCAQIESIQQYASDIPCLYCNASEPLRDFDKKQPLLKILLS